jgi:hypothetical protein
MFCSKIGNHILFCQFFINHNFFIKSLLFTAGNYRMDINSVRTPSTNENDYFKIIYLRQYDFAEVMTNLLENTEPFPELSEKKNSEIKLIESEYLLEGALSSLKFSIVVRDFQLTYKSIITMIFPLYYSPHIANDEKQLFC